MIPSGEGISRIELLWRQKAQQNLTAWGLQRPQPLVLAIAEEVAEMADAFDLSDVDERNPGDDRGAELLLALRELGFEIRDYLEESSEDDEGNPLPPADREPIEVPIDEPGQLLAELDDVVPLGYQLQARMLADYGELRRFPNGNATQTPRSRETAPQPEEGVEEREEGENPWDGLDEGEPEP